MFIFMCVFWLFGMSTTGAADACQSEIFSRPKHFYHFLFALQPNIVDLFVGKSMYAHYTIPDDWYDYH